MDKGLKKCIFKIKIYEKNKNIVILCFVKYNVIITEPKGRDYE